VGLLASDLGTFVATRRDDEFAGSPRRSKFLVTFALALRCRAGAGSDDD